VGEVRGILGCSDTTVHGMGRTLGAKGAGRNVVYDRRKVDALARSIKEAKEEIAKLSKTHVTAAEAKNLLGIHYNLDDFNKQLVRVPSVSVEVPLTKGKRRHVFFEKEALFKRFGKDVAEMAGRPQEERMRALDGALASYAQNRDTEALFSSVQGIERADLEAAAVRYRQMLAEARNRTDEEAGRQAFPLSSSASQRIRENKAREGAKTSARDEHNRLLAMEGALRELLVRKKTEWMGKGSRVRRPTLALKQILYKKLHPEG